jgi:Fe-S oxidoreductase
VLAPRVRDGKDVVVPQPTCAYVLRNDYPDFLASDDAALVAEHTFDASEYLLARHREEALDTDFGGSTYGTILWQNACHYRAQMIGPKSKQLLELTGADVTAVDRCSAIDGTWGLRAENVELAKRVAKPRMDKVAESTADLVVGDCHLSNTAIKESTGTTPSHPMQVMARAYGIEYE